MFAGIALGNAKLRLVECRWACNIDQTGLRNALMTKVLVLGAGGQIARWAIEMMTGSS